ncbi:MAG: hypothetical protein O7D93_11900 [Acidobacteria bacterium]|nr:hypothetical protein [Acidobacteriota bacterium]
MSFIRVACLFRSSLLTVLFALLTPSSALAEATIQQYFLDLSDYQFEQLSELSPTEEQAGIGPFSGTLLEEYILLSYSRWAVRPEGLSELPALELEIYEMKDALGAFGMFSIWPSFLNEAPQERLNLTVDNSYSNQSLVLWRGHFFLHISDPEPGLSSRETLGNLAQTLVEEIPLLNFHPGTVLHLPKEGLIRESVRFYLGESALALNRHLPEGLSAQMGFEKDIEVAFAQYAPNGHALFLIGYPTTALAADYLVSLQNAMQDYFSPQGVYMKRAGLMIAIFFGPEPTASEILSKIHYIPTITWLYQKDLDPERVMREMVGSFMGVVRAILVMILLFIALTASLGITAGIARHQLLKRFPKLFKQSDLVNLKLN